jgi:1,4-alpha-glucan branching enzyme
VLSFLRKARDGSSLLVVANFTPVPRDNYMVGVSKAGDWRECLNSDATLYGGSGVGNQGGVASVPVPTHGRDHALRLRLPPLGLLVFRHQAARIAAAAPVA